MEGKKRDWKETIGNCCLSNKKEKKKKNRESVNCASG